MELTVIPALYLIVQFGISTLLEPDDKASEQAVHVAHPGGIDTLLTSPR